jgi:hypothetical protein
MGAILDAIAHPSTSGSSRRAEPSLGTRFLVFPQPPYVTGYEKPEVVWLATSIGGILAGPSDKYMYVADPIEAKRPYAFPSLPPYAGGLRPPAEPGSDGHFDHILPGSPAFLSAHSYACARRVLDICVGYLRREVSWFFRPSVQRLEIIPHIPDWDNAQSGFGYLELGEGEPGNATSCFALNFDSIAHEMGHLVLLSELGLPEGDGSRTDFFAYHEAIADFISLLGLLHFDTAIDRILRRTGGDLLINNELDRFAELSDEKQVRSFNNSLRLGDVSDEVHDRSKPFAALLFDCLVEVYQSILFDSGLSDLDPRRFSNLRREMAPQQIEAHLNRSKRDYPLRHFASKAALQEARDVVAECMARSWASLDPEALTFRAAAEALLEEAERGRARRYVNQFEDCMRWREILS